MATRGYRPGEFYHIPDGSEVLRHHARIIAKDQLIERIKERNKTAVDTVPTYIYLFPALRAGRRCSCWDIEVDADRQCPACFGSGIVGGWTKFGTHLEVIDVTRPGLRTSNVIPDWKNRTKPLRFTLISGATFGSIETRIDLKNNIGVVDSLATSHFIPEGGGASLKAFVKAPADEEFVPLSKTTLTERLFNPWIEVRVEFSRISGSAESPKLDTIYMRYQNQLDNIIKANIPRADKSILLGEMGAFDEWQLMNFWTDASQIKSLTTDDFIVTASGRTTWKLVHTKNFAPHGKNTSWDFEARIVQGYEPYKRIPVGIIKEVDEIERQKGERSDASTQKFVGLPDFY